MRIEITHKFQKQLNECNDKRIRSKVANIIQDVILINSMVGFNNLKKLTGYKNSYPIRIGIVIDHDVVIFAAFDHRSAIYKYFL